MYTRTETFIHACHPLSAIQLTDPFISADIDSIRSFALETEQNEPSDQDQIIVTAYGRALPKDFKYTRGDQSTA